MFKFSAVYSGIKNEKKPDLGLIYSEIPFSCWGVFTKNKIKAGPVIYSMDSIGKFKKFKVIIANSGNANSCTGIEGILTCYEIEKKIREIFEVEDNYGILQASTGVIGVRLPKEKIIKNLGNLKENLRFDNYKNFAHAILTTDTFPKIYEIKDKDFYIIGIAKGAGMIHPDMATMLAFILTSARIKMMGKVFKEIVNETFNSISVDGDTSTNDTVFLASTETTNPDPNKFKSALYEVCDNLAKMIVKDGEGATKFVELKVVGAKSNIDAKKICEKIATSILVKTAIFGADPNWGRILCAIGNSGANVTRDKIEMYFGKFKVVENGIVSKEFDEKTISDYLKKNSHIEIIVNLNIGDGKWKYYTCDISYDYVKINSEYRT